MPTRRIFLAGLPLAIAFPVAAAARPPVVTVLGDSLTSGWGLEPSNALPRQLAAELARLRVSAIVRGAGVPGDTTAGGLARVGRLESDTGVCVVMLGANDFLLSIDPREIEANLDAIVRTLQTRRIGVVLVGGQAIGRGRPAYASVFNRIFPAVAERRRALFAPDILAGIAGQPRLNQADGLHPNAAGTRMIAARLAPVVARGLGR